MSPPERGDGTIDDVSGLLALDVHRHPNDTGVMPEAVEAELYRRSLEAAVGSRVVAVDTADRLVVPDPDAVREILDAAMIEHVWRHGKAVVLASDHGEVTFHFGMTGRILVGERDPVPALVYGTTANDDRFDRFGLRVRRDASEILIRLSDPRRLARVRAGVTVVDAPDVTEISAIDLARRARPSPRSARALKTVLLDQGVVTGLGNMLADDVAFRCGLDPARSVADLGAPDWDSLARAIHESYRQALERGGSHRGELAAELRHPGSRCPRDSTVLERRRIGGRTTWFCPSHQR